MEYLLKSLLLITLLSAVSSYRISRIWPSKDIVQEELTQHLNGIVERPWDEDYYDLIMQKNMDFIRRPGAIALVNNRDDIRKCILFARKYNLGVNMRSSGHCFLGRSTADHVLLIDTRNMNKILSIDVNDPESDTWNSATVQAGTTWAQIYEEVDKHKLVAVGPTPRSVAVSGYLLGGGHSPITRRYGLGADNVLRISMVSATGDYVECTNISTTVHRVDGSTETIQNNDLFWALRGGGAAFGVITEFKLQLHPAPDGFIALLMMIPIEHPIHGEPLKDFLPFYTSFLVYNLTNNWGGHFHSNNAPSEDPIFNVTQEGSATFTLYHCGNWSEAMRSIKPLVDHISLQGRSRIYFHNYSSFWDYVKNNYQGLEGHQYIVSRFFRAEDFASPNVVSLFTDDLMESFWYRSCTVIHTGGKAAEISADTSAVSVDFRRALWLVDCSAGYLDPRDRAFAIEQFQPYRRKLYTMGKGGYYNEADYNLDKWQDEFWGDHYERLQQIKRVWDPENFFTCHMCVAVDSE